MAGELTTEEMITIVFTGLKELRRQKFETELQLLINQGTDTTQFAARAKQIELGIERLEKRFYDLSQLSSPTK